MSKDRGVLLEVCVGSVEDAVRAESAGADRIELCGALEMGGVSPSAGVIEETVRAVSVDVVVMVRPTSGGFWYADADFRAMLRDADVALAAGAAGIVFGCLDQDARVDEQRTARIVKLADGKQTVFHRAIDLTPDPMGSLETLVGAGVTRVLTSGGHPTALAGATVLRDLVAHAGGRIEILPGGGIRADNVGQLIAATGCGQVHASLSCPGKDPVMESARVRLASGGSSANTFRVVDVDRVREMASLLAGM